IYFRFPTTTIDFQIGKQDALFAVLLQIQERIRHKESSSVQHISRGFACGIDQSGNRVFWHGAAISFRREPAGSQRRNPTGPLLDKATGSRFVLSSLPEKGRFTMISPYD